MNQSGQAYDPDRCNSVPAGNPKRRCMKAKGHGRVHSDTTGLWLDEESLSAQDAEESVAATAVSPRPDPVNHPSHYTQGGIECIDAIKAALGPEQFAGFLCGNALKYLWRCEHKGNQQEDLEKAAWYLNRPAAQGVD